MKLSEVAREVILMAQALNRARLAQGSEDDSPVVSAGARTPVKTPTAEECRLREFLERQPAAVIYMLMAIMYLGRGDFDAEADLLDRYTDMSETFANPKWAIRQMMDKVPLPEYLEEGLQRLAELGVDVDRLLTG